MTRERLALPLLLVGLPVGVLAWAAVLGLAVARQAEAGPVALSSAFLVFGPAVLALLSPREGRGTRVALTLLLWSIGLLAVLPVYFPGERRDAVATGLALLTGDLEGTGMARAVADSLPDEPEVAVAQVPSVRPVEVEALPPAAPLDDHQIALPYEGEGRRLSVPVVFDHDGRTVETFMMLDTGATYTTLPDHVLATLGIFPGPDDPELTLNTANGQRQARVVLLDRVWLGDLELGGVAVTTCEDCASDENAGLLGLNVTGAYNMTIDADRREVVFSRRARFNRRLDVRPFSDLQARFTRFAGGRVEVTVDLANHATRPIDLLTARVVCGDEAWKVDVGNVPAGGEATTRRRLPRHPRCATYQISLDDAVW